MKHIAVAAAIIRRRGKILICKRGEGGSCARLWEFPGGKMEAGEDPAQAAARECAEELGITVRVGELLWRTEHTYPDSEVELFFFAAELAAGEPEARVHEEIVWARPAELAGYAFCPADGPLIDILAKEDDDVPLP